MTTQSSFGRRVWIFSLMLAMTMTVFSSAALAATSIPFTVNLSEAVNVVTTGGTPQIAVDVGGTTRYATYTSGTGTNALIFTYNMVAGDVDLDGVTLTSPIDPNGGTIKDLNGNTATLTFTVPNTSNVKVNYPSLGMDFIYDADGRYTLNGTTYNDLTSFLSAAGGTFTRGSIGTYFDSSATLQTAASGAPRFDYDPVTHAANGLFIEESRTNLRTYSAEMNNTGVWTISGMGMVADTYTAPDGSGNADKMTPTSGTGTHRIREVAGTSVTAGTSYTGSVFIRSNGQQYIDLYLGYTNFPNNNGATFDLVNGTITYTFTSTTPKIQNIGNGWYRCSITVTASVSGSTNSSFFIVHSTNSGTANINTTANGTDSYYVWGAQVEAGGFPTSYIPTTVSAVTRQADIFTLPTGSWFNGTEGTAFISTKQPPLSSNLMRFVSFYKDTSNRLLFQKNTATSVRLLSQISGSTVASPSATSTFSGNYIKIAGAYKLNNYGLSVDNSTASTATGAIPTGITQADLGSNGTDWLNTSLSQFKYYPLRAPDGQLKLLTQ